jgi:putative membrane protein
MVVSSKLPWAAIFKLHAPVLSVVGAIAIAVMVLDRIYDYHLPSSPVPYQIAGVALAILLGFRNSAAYDRWWEGRKIWGGIVNASRALGRQITTFTRQGEGVTSDEVRAFQRDVLHRHVAWLNALRCQLRGQDARGEIDGLVSAEEKEALGAQKNVALGIFQTNSAAIAEAANRGMLDELRLASIDRTLAELVGLQGACERIKGTPIPPAYAIFTTTFIRVYCCALPLGLVEHFGVATAVVVVALSFMFLVLSAIGRFLEDPFTTGPNAIALTAICRTIEINLRQMLGETDLPPPVLPKKVGKVELLM